MSTKTTVKTSPGRRLQVGENYFTVMGGEDQPWLLRIQDVVVASSNHVPTARVSPGERVLMGGHIYTVMGTDDQPRLEHLGVDPASKRAAHRFHNQDCPARGF